jgi:hypothetical protein
MYIYIYIYIRTRHTDVCNTNIRVPELRGVQANKIPLILLSSRFTYI